MIVLTIALQVGARATELDAATLVPSEPDVYMGIDASDLDWLCPRAEGRLVVASSAELTRDATCTLIRDVGRGRVAAERTAPVVARVQDELNQDQDYAWASEAALIELTALGLDPDQVGGTTARYVSRVSTGSATEHAVGIVVYVDRYIEGVPVVGNRAIVMFDLDYSLRAVFSTWPSISVKHNSWSLPVDGDCSPAGASVWAARDVEPGALTEVELSTALLSDGPSDRVRLVVLSETMVAGPDGSSKRQIRVCDGGVE